MSNTPPQIEEFRNLEKTVGSVNPVHFSRELLVKQKNIFKKHYILQTCLHTIFFFKAIEELYQSFSPGPRRLA
jgi:hypothetical protein